MAITRAQQARQMYKKGSKPVEQAGVMNYMPSEMVTVPKIAKSSPDTPTAKLAYITPKEQDILVDLNLYGSLDGKPNRGPGGIPSLEGDFGSPTGGTYSGGSGDEKPGSGGGANQSGGGDDRRESYITEYSSKAKVKGGGAKKPTIGGAGDEDYEDFQYTKDNRTKAMEDKFKKDRNLATLNLLSVGVPPSNAPGILGTGLNLLRPFRNLSLQRNIDYFKGLKERGRLADYDLSAEGYKAYMQARLAGDIDAAGNPIVQSGRDDDQPLVATNLNPFEDTDTDTDTETEQDDFSRFFRLMADGGRVEDIEREAMFLGGITKGIKKAVRGVKKIAKSPIGKLAIGALLFKGAGGMKGLSSFFGKGSFSPFKAELADVLGADAGFGPSGLGRLLGDKFVNQVTGNLTGLGKFAAVGVPAALAGAMTDKQKDQTFKQPDYPDFNMQAYLDNPYKYTPTRQMADGGIMRAGYQEGSKEPVAKKTMPLLDMDGKEMDFREEGGFVPIGRMEKADDVPARLSKNEFVFTADAVRNAGDGDVDKGAEVMYNMMKNLESGGNVSEESQGLEGAREMFQTSKRLEEVL